MKAIDYVGCVHWPGEWWMCIMIVFFLFFLCAADRFWFNGFRVFLWCVGMGRVCVSIFFIFMVFLKPPPLITCVTTYLLVKILFGLKAKQIRINHWISKINLNNSFANLETKQRKMDH
jgi:hypothetical protein